MGFIDAIEKLGYSRASLEAKFTNKELRTSDKEEDIKLRRLIERHGAWVRSNFRENIHDVRVFSAIDSALDISQDQVSQSMMRGLIDKDPSSPEVLTAIKTWKLEHILKPVQQLVDGKLVGELDAKGNPKYILDVPTFFNVFLPLTVSYFKARWAKMWKDRDTIPLYKYAPASNSLDGHVVGRVITESVAKQSDQMGHRETERDSLGQALMYSYSFAFAASDYEIEESYWLDDGKTKPEKYIVKAGVKFVIPHPSKVIFDRSVPIASINTDTGMTILGYWSAVKFADIEAKKYWNLDNVNIANDPKNRWINPDDWRVYSEYYPCTMTFPSIASENDNQRDFSWYRRTDHMDNAVHVINLFHKLVPKDHGLYDCDVPVWHRFTYAGDGTVIDCVPFAYNPCSVSTGDFDPNRRRNTSLVQEIVPFQDMIQNLLTQTILTVKNNLENTVFYDATMVTPTQLEYIKNTGEKRYRVRNFIPFNRRKMDAAGTSPDKVFEPIQLDRQQTGELFTTISTLLTILERVLGYSAQEVGGVAAHEQSATESSITNQNTENRVGLTASFMDPGRDARSKAVYDAWMEYDPKQIDVSLSGVTDAQIKSLEALQFKVEPIPGTKSIKITGSRANADLASIARFRPASERPRDEKVAQAMLQALSSLVGNPQIIEKVGIEQIIRRLAEVWEYLGVPSDWRLDLDQMPKQIPPEEVVAQIVVKILGEYDKQAKQEIKEGLAAPIEDSIGKLAQNANQVDATITDHEQAIKALIEKVQQLRDSVAQSDVAIAQIAGNQVSNQLPITDHMAATGIQPADIAMAAGMIDQPLPVIAQPGA